MLGSWQAAAERVDNIGSALRTFVARVTFAPYDLRVCIMMFHPTRIAVTDLRFARLSCSRQRVDHGVDGGRVSNAELRESAS